MDLRLLSREFVEGGSIPTCRTCDGENLSPPLHWEHVPEGTKSLALIAEDLDTPVGTICHWVVYNIPPGAGQLPEGIPHQRSLADGTHQGINAMWRTGYMGPCPPWGTHRYVFHLYALDTVLELHGRIGQRRLRKAIEGHVLAQARLKGRYARVRSE
jgi:Raf kinase inhibitor-like YbhB/YbcL family protein